MGRCAGVREAFEERVYDPYMGLPQMIRFGCSSLPPAEGAPGGGTALPGRLVLGKVKDRREDRASAGTMYGVESTVPGLPEEETIPWLGGTIPPDMESPHAIGHILREDVVKVLRAILRDRPGDGILWSKEFPGASELRVYYLHRKDHEEALGKAYCSALQAFAREVAGEPFRSLVSIGGPAMSTVR